MREGQYTLYAISTPSKQEAIKMQEYLKPLGHKTEIVKEGKLYRVQLGAPSVKRHIAYKRLQILERAGIRTGQVLLS